MSTSKIFDKIAILLICFALVFSLAIAMTWTNVESSSVMNVSLNDIADITEYINLDEESGEIDIIVGGTYYISGTLDEGRIVVDIDSTEYAILILAGAEIYCSSDSAIYVANSGNCALYLAEGTENIISSGETNRSSADDDASGGAVCFKDNATICGEGSLTIYGYINNGIHCSNDLFIESGNITVSAVNNGIKAKDNLIIDGGNISIAAANAGLKSGESGDSNSGNIVINGGLLDITQSYEGMEANQITINDGETYIVASDDGINACGGEDSFGAMGGGNRGEKDDKGLGDFGMGGTPTDGGKSKGGRGGRNANETSGAAFGGKEESESDGMHQVPDKADGTSDGAMQPPEGFDSKDMKDAPEKTDGTSDGAMQPPEGFGGNNMSEAPEKPDGTSGAAMEAFEGFEKNDSERPEMPDGVDFDNFEFGSMDDEESEEEDETKLPSLTINGGYLYVLAGGDGLDSNGDLIINGGTVIVDGPSDSGNGALDSGSENGGTLLINGGTVIAVGASGMAEVPEDDSAQNVISCNISFSAGDRIAVSDSNGNVIFEYNAAKSGDSIVFSSPQLELDETYIVSAADSSVEITLTDTVTSSSSAYSNDRQYNRMRP